LLAPPPDFAARLQAAGCAAVFGPRAGSFTGDGALEESPPGPLRELLGLTVRCVESLPPTVRLPVKWRDGDGSDTVTANRWREFVDASGAQTVAAFDGDGGIPPRHPRSPLSGGGDGDGDGGGAVFRHGNACYLAARPDARLLDAVVARALACAGVAVSRPPADVRVRRRGEFLWFFNHGSAPVEPGVGGEILLGARPIPPAGVLALRAVP